MKYTKIIKAEEKQEKYLIDNADFNKIESEYNKVREALYKLQSSLTDGYYDIAGGNKQEGIEKIFNVLKGMSEITNTNMANLWQTIVDLAYK